MARLEHVPRRVKPHDFNPGAGRWNQDPASPTADFQDRSASGTCRCDEEWDVESIAIERDVVVQIRDKRILVVVAITAHRHGRLICADRSTLHRPKPRQPRAIDDNGHPEEKLKRRLARFVVNQSLGDERAGPAAEETHDEKRIFGRSATATQRGRLVRTIEDKSGETRRQVKRRNRNRKIPGYREPGDQGEKQASQHDHDGAPPSPNLRPPFRQLTPQHGSMAAPLILAITTNREISNVRERGQRIQ